MKPRRQHKHMPTEMCGRIDFYSFRLRSLICHVTIDSIGIRMKMDSKERGDVLDGRLLFAWSDLSNEMEKINFYISSNWEVMDAPHILFACINSINNQTCTHTTSIGMCARTRECFILSFARQHSGPHLLYPFHSFEYKWTISMAMMYTIIIFSNTHSL